MPRPPHQHRGTLQAWPLPSHWKGHPHPTPGRRYDLALALEPQSEAALEGKRSALQQQRQQQQVPVLMQQQQQEEVQQQQQQLVPLLAAAATAVEGCGSSNAGGVGGAGGAGGVGGAGGASGAAAAAAGMSLDGDGMSQLMAFFGNPEMARMAESVAASFVSGDESAVREAQQAMGSMFGGIDVDAALSAAGLGGGGDGGGDGGGSDGVGGGSGGSGADGGLADFSKLLDDPALMSTLGGLASSLTAPPNSAVASAAGSEPAAAAAAPAAPSQPPAAAAARKDSSSNGKARASCQD